MRIEIEIPVSGVYIKDLDKVAVPAFCEETEDGMKLSFLGIDALKDYQTELLINDEEEGFEQRNEIRAKSRRNKKSNI